MKRCLPLVAVLSLLFVSCATNTPQKRIEKNPERFKTLNTEEQAEVSQGRISRGMSKDAVFIALGKPDKTTIGDRSGSAYEVWEYYDLQPVVTHGFYGGFGRGFGGGFGRGRFGHGGFGRFGGGGFFHGGFFPQVNYIPRKGASVIFTNGTVDSFESVRGSLYR